MSECWRWRCICCSNKVWLVFCFCSVNFRKKSRTRWTIMLANKMELTKLKPDYPQQILWILNMQKHGKKKYLREHNALPLLLCFHFAGEGNICTHSRDFGYLWRGCGQRMVIYSSAKSAHAIFSHQENPQT